MALSDSERATRHHLRCGLRYALRIFLGVVVLWEISAVLGDAAPVWATVSLVMCSEIDTEPRFCVPCDASATWPSVAQSRWLRYEQCVSVCGDLPLLSP